MDERIKAAIAAKLAAARALIEAAKNGGTTPAPTPTPTPTPDPEPQPEVEPSPTPTPETPEG